MILKIALTLLLCASSCNVQSQDFSAATYWLAEDGKVMVSIQNHWYEITQEQHSDGCPCMD